MCSIWMTLHLVLDVQPHSPCITSFWVWLQMCLALQKGVALPKHLFWAALSLWQNGWGMWIPFDRRALSSVVRGIWRWYARCRYRESYCLAVCQISWMSIAMESKLLFGFDRWGDENEEVHEGSAVICGDERNLGGRTVGTCSVVSFKFNEYRF